jgi:predicted GIY-YIG superfamily endonuclease
MHGTGARFVYILRSESDSARHYVGRTSDVDQRFDWHNAGPSGYTVQNRPWSIVVSLEFPDERAAAALRTLPEVRLRPRIRQTSFRTRGIVRRKNWVRPKNMGARPFPLSLRRLAVL